jgi:hypothetical protein
MKAAAFRCMPGSSRCRLTQRNGGDPPPLLRGHYTHFTLLRGGPPLSGASVLSASRLEPLGPDVSATLTTVAFDHSRSRWLGISDLIAEPEGPSFISSTVAHPRVDRRCS